MDYAEEIAAAQELHQRLLLERRERKYEKHFQLCKDILMQMVDFSLKAVEYRELTEGYEPL